MPCLVLKTTQDISELGIKTNEMVRLVDRRKLKKNFEREPILFDVWLIP